MTKHRKKRGNAAAIKRRVWTIVCILLVCAIAFVLRTVIVYELYPLEYQDEIKNYGAEYAIDKYLVCAVICAESHFDEQAVSPKGAVGLMQIMPGTGEWAAGIIGIDGYTEDMLNDPGVNIHIGCWYLRYLSDMFGGIDQHVLAAYNAGPANVQNWIDDDCSLEDIPFEETENYLEKVEKYNDIYKGLYNDF